MMKVLQKSGAFVAASALVMATTPAVVADESYESNDTHSLYLPASFSSSASKFNIANFAGTISAAAGQETPMVQAAGDDYDFGDPEPVRMNRAFVMQLVNARVKDSGFSSTEA